MINLPNNRESACRHERNLCKFLLLIFGFDPKRGVGNVQAGYGLMREYGYVGAIIITRAAEYGFAWGEFITGDRRKNGTNWKDDAKGSFEMNDIGIDEAVLDKYFPEISEINKMFDEITGK